VKLLFDENLSHRLSMRINDLFPGSSHVAFESLIQSRDIEIWEYAGAHGFAIVTADGDFYDLALSKGAPPESHLAPRLRLSDRHRRAAPARPGDSRHRIPAGS
jgi:predicted nuclease of predicted toxin-antitoxin system